MRIAQHTIFIVCVTLWCSVEATAQTIRASRTSISQINRIQFRLVSGRITATTRAYGGTSSLNKSSNNYREKLTIGHANGVPIVDYDLTTSGVRLEIDVSDGSRVVIKQEPTEKGKYTPLVFEQQPDFPLTLTVGADDEQKTFRAASLWHLWLAQPELCETTLWPLLRLLRPNWNLAETGGAIEEALYHAAKTQNAPKREHWARLVDDLGDDEFSVREAADRSLRKSGQMVLPYLRELSPESLDAEQRFRIRRMIAALSGGETEDTPTVVATWLCADKQIWLALLSRAPTADQRRTAVDQLSYLLDQPIEFDPAADEDTRAHQLEALQRKFGDSELPVTPPTSD